MSGNGNGGTAAAVERPFWRSGGWWHGSIFVAFASGFPALMLLLSTGKPADVTNSVPGIINSTVWAVAVVLCALAGKNVANTRKALDVQKAALGENGGGKS